MRSRANGLQHRDAARELVRLNPVLFDTETTGFGKDAEIVEISLVDLAGNVLFDSLVKPTCSIPAETTRIHGITDQRVADAKDIRGLMPELVRALKGRTLTSFNLAFDSRMILQSLALSEQIRKDHRLETTLTTAWEHGLCVMNIFSGWYKTQPQRQQGPGSRSLTAATQVLRVGPPEPAHQALGDAQAARRVLLALAGM